MKSEYDIRGGVRGKYVVRYAAANEPAWWQCEPCCKGRPRRAWRHEFLFGYLVLLQCFWCRAVWQVFE
jgi:hypothetical protein